MTRPPLQLIESSPLRYLLSLPRDAGTGPRPVLVFLHGYREGHPREIREALTAHGPLRDANPAIARDELIVVAPQLPMQGDRWHSYADAVRDIVRQVQAEHGGDPRRTYLTGFSFGGNGVWDLTLAKPELWTALWAVDPTRVPARDPGLAVWLSAGNYARALADDFKRILGTRPPGDGTPGDRVYADAGLGHGETSWAAYEDERIYRWLLARERPSS